MLCTWRQIDIKKKGGRGRRNQRHHIGSCQEHVSYRYPIYMRLWITNLSTLCVWFYRLIRPCVWKLGWNTYIHETTLLFSTMCSDSVDLVFIFSSHFVAFFTLFDCFIRSWTRRAMLKIRIHKVSFLCAKYSNKNRKTLNRDVY
jgi:hypothetical protein